MAGDVGKFDAFGDQEIMLWVMTFNSWYILK